MNNKMKKFNKILMMTVAILLTLVLASTSVVSGIFAKYVITKSASTEVSLKAFGVTLTVDGGAYGTVTRTPDATSSTPSTLSVSVTNLQLAPGDTLDDVVKFTIAGTGANDKPNVGTVNLKVKVTVESVDEFSVQTSDVTAMTPETGIAFKTANYIPIGFSLKSGLASNSATRTDFLAAWTTPTDNADLASKIRTAMVSKAGFTTSGSDAVEKTIYTNNEFTDKYISFGFTCWKNGTTGLSTDVSDTEANLIQTYLSQNNSTAKFKVIYTVSLEQG